MKNLKGMTLVEMMVTVVLFSFIVAASVTVFAAGNSTWNNYEASIATQREARNALTMLTKDLREASSISITQDSSSATLSFSRPVIGSVTYTWSAAGGTPKKIIRQNQSVTRIVAQDISNLAFTDNGSNIVVNITSSKVAVNGPTCTFNVKEKVAIR